MRRLPERAPIVSAAQMRAAERAAFEKGASPEALMEQAGAAVACETARLAAGRPVLVLAGPGNNGGDAYAAARLLDAMGIEVAVAALGGPGEGAAARMAARWRGRTTSLSEAPRYSVVLDGLLGIGAVRPFDPPIGRAIDAVLDTADLCVAIDLPSGVDADTGRGGLRAGVTIALGALKPGNVLSGGADGGHVLLADIGVPVSSNWSTIGSPRLDPPHHDADKFSRGMVVVVAGAMPGAAWLAAVAALHGGAGYVVLTGFAPAGGAPHALIRTTLGHVRDLARLLDDDRIDTVVVGPGLGRDDRASALLDAVLASKHDLVIDGDALTLLGRDAATTLADHRRRICLTPHAGEFARMFDGAGNKIERTLAAAAASGSWVVHKGPDTVVGMPDGTAVVAAASTPWLATAGAGDVLAGLIAGRMATGDRGSDPASNAVWLHSRAAALAGAAFSADDLLRHVPAAVAQCLTR